MQGSEHTPADNHLYSVMVPALKSGGLASGLLQPLSHYLAGLTLPPPLDSGSCCLSELLSQHLSELSYQSPPCPTGMKLNKTEDVREPGCIWGMINVTRILMS